MKLTGSNSLPFTFLIIFLTLFLGFMCIGIWARRITVFFRQRLGLPVVAHDPALVPRRRRSRLEKPALWDVVIAGTDRTPTRWEEMKPLAVWEKRLALMSEPTTHWNTTTEPFVQPMPAIVGSANISLRTGLVTTPISHPPAETSFMSNVIAMFSGFRRLSRPRVEELPKESPDEDRVETLGVAVFITMPSPESDSKQNHPELGGAYRDSGGLEIGIAEVPWLGEHLQGLH